MKSIVGWLLLITATAFFLYGVYKGIKISWPAADPANSDPLKIPEPLNSFTTAIAALLLANFGAVLGISLVNGKSGLSKMMGLGKGTRGDIPPPTSVREKIQYAAVLVYLVCLISCLITWIHNGFSTDPREVFPFVSQTANTFFGVLTAYVAALLAGSSQQ